MVIIQADLQKKLRYVTEDVGVKASVIAEKTGIPDVQLSRFKNGKAELPYVDMITLYDYLMPFVNISC